MAYSLTRSDINNGSAVDLGTITAERPTKTSGIILTPEPLGNSTETRGIDFAGTTLRIKLSGVLKPNIISMTEAETSGSSVVIEVTNTTGFVANRKIFIAGFSGSTFYSEQTTVISIVANTSITANLTNSYDANSTMSNLPFMVLNLFAFVNGDQATTATYVSDILGTLNVKVLSVDGEFEGGNPTMFAYTMELVQTSTDI